MKNFLRGIVVVVVVALLFCGNLGAGADTFPDYGNYFVASFSWMNFLGVPVFEKDSELTGNFGLSGNGVRYYDLVHQMKRTHLSFAFDATKSLSFYRFYENATIYYVLGDAGQKYCADAKMDEEPMVPFGSTCGNQGEALVFNQKATSWGGCATQESVFWDSDVLSDQSIYTANNRIQQPLRQLLHLYVESDSDSDPEMWKKRGDQFMMDYVSFEQKTPPKNAFQLPVECFQEDSDSDDFKRNVDSLEPLGALLNTFHLL
eukprot:CAMPEP_0201501814 /NCGR_PEP_ID=MMETSP0151_2-20130828/83794_1 /ASSEMBLY_ACC=CAM_ASM_000257 /TAXON_ID=200890 /ORGANISM="Paramoeba atlantica, Strain 621/1 / CCAP 1560/9" /LENGTH=259 /DNA_ID=CAMNT_0047895351 /DNA_START=147 /DNA_END=926 /DNA_ORIENTATION=+